MIFIYMAVFTGLLLTLWDREHPFLYCLFIAALWPAALGVIIAGWWREVEEK